MVFSDPVFLFFFLPAVILMTKLSPKPLRNAVLLIFSLLFYAWGEPIYILLMLAVIVINYLAGLRLLRFPADTAPGRRRFVLTLAILLNLTILGVFKYTGFFAELLNSAAGLHLPAPQIILPIGISFYIFQSMSYVIDVYRGDAEAQRNILNFGTYVALFPQLIAGPIVRYRDIALQLAEREETVKLFADGATEFVYGLSKKVLLANQMGLLADRMLLSEGGTVSAWVGMAAYTLQIYFDFSGYSDMAIGLGQMFGFRFRKNFDYPYISQSITEFWRRWHMSLSSWFKEYVYIPLGGNRKGLFRQCLNLLIVWLLTGLWHGASLNFVLWGLYYALLLILEKLLFGRLLRLLPGLLRHLVTLLIVAFGWGIFYYTDVEQWFCFIRRLCLWSSDSGEALRCMLAYIPVFYIACFAATRRPIRAILRIRNGAFAFLEIPWLVMLFLLCTSVLVSQGYNPFIYFRF